MAEDLHLKCVEAASHLQQLADLVSQCPTTEEFIGDDLDLIIQCLGKKEIDTALSLAYQLREKIKD